MVSNTFVSHVLRCSSFVTNFWSSYRWKIFLLTDFTRLSVTALHLLIPYCQFYMVDHFRDSISQLVPLRSALVLYRHQLCGSAVLSAVLSGRCVGLLSARDEYASVVLVGARLLQHGLRLHLLRHNHFQVP